MALFWIAQFFLWGAVFCVSDVLREKLVPEIFPGPRLPGPRPQPLTPCSTLLCRDNQVCVEESGKPRCVPPVPGVCTASGDPHIRTFDYMYYDFMGTCTYTFAKVCGDVGKLPKFTVLIKNDNRGNVAVSYVAVVTIIIGPYTIVIKRGEYGWMRVNNFRSRLPCRMMNGQLKFSQSGNSVKMQLGDHVKLFYDWDHFLTLEVSIFYYAKMCGMCGNFNQYQRDDFRTPDSTLAPDAIAFGSSWKVEDNTVCWHDCRGPCLSCPVDSAKKYRTVDYCGLITNKNEDGPFRDSHAVVDPTMHMENCVTDLCINGGFKNIFCKAVEAYAVTCQRAGMAIKEWREAAGCPMHCPENSSYKPCGRACPATCEDPEGKADCTDPCVESCECNPGFVLSGGECIPKEEPGCSYNGFTYAPNEVMWNDNACKQRCVCNGKTREVECKDSPCKEQEECAVRNGIQDCYPRSYGVCTASGDPHYITFDGTCYDFQGTCIYQFTGLCDPNSELIHFNVMVQNRRVDHTAVSITEKVYIEVYDQKFEASAQFPSKVTINGILMHMPYMPNDDRFSIHLNPNSVVFSFDFGLRVTYDYSSIITVTVPSTYANALCGLCGNFNGNSSDDLTPKEGLNPTDPIPFGKSWKVQDVFGCSDDGHEVCNELESEKKRQMDTGSECGIMMDTAGPFRDCIRKVDPKTHFENCVFDNCILKNRQTGFCSVITSYVKACQEAGVTVYPWRRQDLCPFSCPANSEYQMCADACPATCSGLSKPKGCSGNCTEGCQCKKGFILSGGQCVDMSECGCCHNGAYYSLGDSVYVGESCNQQCSCSEGGVMSCVPLSCSRADECRIQNGVLGCFSRFSATCTAAGYSHYRTFDDHTYNFGGYCSYVLAESSRDIKEGGTLPVFRVTMKREKRDFGAGRISSITVEAHGMILTLNRGENGVIQVNGQNEWLPVTLMSGMIRAEPTGQGVNIAIDVIISVTVSCDWLVSITVPSNYMNNVYGLCGNYNGLAEDDAGKTPKEISAIGNKWKVSGEPDVCEGCDRRRCPICRDENKKILLQSNSCGIIGDPSGPFAKFHSNVDPKSYVNGCVTDLCPTNGEDSSAACSHVSMYAEACKTAGFTDITWRKKDFCPILQ